MGSIVLSVCSHKGGTGKTTTSLSLAAALAKGGAKVLVVDLDPQANLTYSLELNTVEKDLVHVFLGEVPLEGILCVKEGMFIAPASMDLADIELSLQGAEDRTSFLKEIIVEAKQEFDWILFDCPPSRSLLTINALVASDYVLTPILLDVLSIQGLLFMIKTIFDVKRSYNASLEFLGMVAVNVDLRKKLSKEVQQFIRQNMEYPMCKTVVRTNSKIAEAPSHGLTIFSYDPKSTAAKDYSDLTKELIKLTKQNGTRKEFEIGQAYTA